MKKACPSKVRSTIEKMEIRVRQHGGVLGVDRSVNVVDGTVTVVDQSGRRCHDLEPDVQERLTHLAAQVAHVPAPHRERGLLPFSDEMETSLDIWTDNEEHRALRLRSGDDAPDAVWELLGTLNEVAL